MIFRRVMRSRISSEARIQPMRRPPQKSFESEPIVRIGASRSKAAMGAGGRPGPSAPGRRACCPRRSAAAARATSSRAPAGRLSGITAPVGFWNVGIRYTSRGEVRATVSRSRVDPRRVAPDGHGHQARALPGEDVDRAHVRRVFHDDRFAALDEQRAREADRLLRAVRHEDLVLGRLEPRRREMLRDRLPQRRKPHREIAGAPRELAQRLLVDARGLPREHVGRGQVRAEKLDRPARPLGEAAPDRVAAEGARRVLAKQQRGRTRRAPRDPRPAAAAALDRAVPAQLLVGRDDRRAGDRRVSPRGRARTGSRSPARTSPRSIAARIAPASRRYTGPGPPAPSDQRPRLATNACGVRRPCQSTCATGWLLIRGVAPVHLDVHLEHTPEMDSKSGLAPTEPAPSVPRRSPMPLPRHAFFRGQHRSLLRGARRRPDARSELRDRLLRRHPRLLERRRSRSSSSSGRRTTSAASSSPRGCST